MTETPAGRLATKSSLSNLNLPFVALLGALTMLPPLAIDVSLPGLPAIAKALHATGGAMQWTLSAFVLAFGAGQLVLGPLSDRFGRKPVLLGGVATFTLAAIACALVTDVYVLIALRLLEGFAACAGTVCARAIVADVAKDRTQATSLQAYVSATNSLAPLAAPLLGVVLLSFLDWRWLYGALAIVGLGLILAILTRLRETSPLTSRGAIAGYRRMLARPPTATLVLFVFCAFGAYFAFIGASSLVLQTQMHVSSFVFAVAFAVNACATMAGSFVAGRFAGTVGAERLMQSGTKLLFVAGAAAFAFDAFAPSALAFTATMAGFAFCYGLVVPGAFAAALANAGADAGSGSALLGSAQMIGGSLGSALAGALPFSPSFSVGIVALIGSLGVVASATAMRRPAPPTLRGILPSRGLLPSERGAPTAPHL